MAAPVMAQESLWMFDGDTYSFSGYFFAGEDIYGECDEDCDDLDLLLYNSAGRFVDSDDLDDAFPVVTAPSDGDYRVQVRMYSCTHPSGCAVDIDSDFGFEAEYYE